MISAEQLKAEQAEEAEKGEGEEGEAEDKPVTIVEGDEYVQRQVPIAEPEYTTIEETEKTIELLAFAKAYHASYECSARNINFKPTIMFAQRVETFTIKNTSQVALNYYCKIVDAETGVVNEKPFSVSPRTSTIEPDCSDSITMTFAPNIKDCRSIRRLLSVKIANLDPELEPLIIEVSGIGERPICSFELPSVERESSAVDSKYKVIEFTSLGTKVRNTKQFMVRNPTGQGYEFEWERVDQKQASVEGKSDADNKFTVQTTRGVVLSGKKEAMILHYTPDTVGEHESFWNFKIPSENIVQPFRLVGTVIEPMVLFEAGKINFGPLLLGGKSGVQRINLVNNEIIPFQFSFSRKSMKGHEGNSLSVKPLQGTIPPQGSLPIEVKFNPTQEISYNYNLVCNVRRKAKPLILNVKGIGYTIHHKVLLEGQAAPITKEDPA